MAAKKKKTYNVTWCETVRYSAEVQATSAEEAEEMITSGLYDENLRQDEGSDGEEEVEAECLDDEDEEEDD